MGKKAKSEGTFDNSNQGALFVNDKGGNDKRPDKTGKLTIKADDFQPDSDGNVIIYLAAWVRESDRVGEYLSLKASPPQDN